VFTRRGHVASVFLAVGTAGRNVIPVFIFDPSPAFRRPCFVYWSSLMRTFSAALIAITLTVSPAFCSPFDGSWNSGVQCPREPSGGAGYTWRFVSTIKDGHLHGQYGTAGNSPSATFDGTLSDSGTGTIHVVGLAGDPKYNLKNVAAGTPIDYQASVQFNAMHGKGERLNGRACHFTFEKR
jgi:hypothetical protein